MLINAAGFLCCYNESMNQWKPVILISLLLSLSALCSGAEVFQVKGIIRKVQESQKQLVIEHEAIEGFMPAMTMPFRVRELSDLEGLQKGDSVQFRYTVESSGSFADAFEVLESQSQTQLKTAEPADRPDVPKLEVDSQVPDFELIDQAGKPTTLTDDQGRYTLLTFIFTRCPVPEYCPLMSRRFQTLQQSSKQLGLAEDLRLLSITLDPEFDRPDVLTEYAKSLDADPQQWHFATGTPEEIDRVTEAFRVYVKEGGNTLNHTLVTALLSPEGVVLEIWRGNRWKPSEILRAFKTHMDGQSGS